MSDSDARWLEVSVGANAESVESVVELLSQYGYNEGVVIEEPYRQDDDGDNLEIDPTRPVIVRTYLPVDAALEQRRESLRRGLWHLSQIGGVGEPSFSEREEEDWANNWKEFFPVLRIGARFVVRPSWRDYTPQADDRVIHIDPGMAFGTGLHPSTELCMLFMEEVDFTDADVLDAGAGSGILSIGAILSGAKHAVAVEIDDVAARALAKNVTLNTMDEQIDVISVPIATALPGERRFPIVLANLIARILVDNADAIAGHVAPGGLIVASGIINEREQLVRDAYEAHGFSVTGRKQAGDWVSLLLQHQAS